MTTETQDQQTVSTLLKRGYVVKYLVPTFKAGEFSDKYHVQTVSGNEIVVVGCGDKLELFMGVVYRD